MKVTVVIPTYNEHENIPELVQRIRASADSDVEILIVDDSPNSKTTDIALSLGCNVIHREDKRGLSSAVIEGISTAGTDAIIVMDADLQHPPETLPKLIRALDTHGFVVASRYVDGGGCREWDLDRKVISRVANLAAQPLVGIKDSVSGFFGFRKAGLPELSTVNTRGFKIMLELLAKGKWDKVVEVPYMFEPRRKGESKLSATKITDYIIQLASLYLYKFRILRFGMVGALGAVIGFPILYTLTEFVGLFYIISAVIAIVCASTSNYFFNNLWTFREKRRSGIKGHTAGWLNYQMLSAGGDGLYLGLLFLLTSVIGIWYMLSAVISCVTIFVLKYLFANRVIWRTK